MCVLCIFLCVTVCECGCMYAMPRCVCVMCVHVWVCMHATMFVLYVFVMYAFVSIDICML